MQIDLYLPFSMQAKLCTTEWLVHMKFYPTLCCSMYDSR